MATRLQMAFSKSAIRRRMALDMMQSENITVRGYKRLMNGVYTEVLQQMPEPRIKLFLYSVLQCYDITPDERAEALKLLQMAETALTAEQREQIYYYLWADDEI